MTTRPPGTGGACATSGGTSETHIYDTADRLIDPGTTYDPWGNTTKLPASDAGGNELTSTYYTDNKLATQTQHGETIGYNLDPAHRTRETVATGTTSSDTINHYAGPEDSPSWTIETPSGHWTRNIPGIGTGLAAIQNNGETPVLELSNLHGDIIATTPLSETSTGLTSTNDTTEYGVPRTSTPPKYSWLGADERQTELPSGIIAMGERSYVPQLGRFLQTDPIPGGSANAYAYTNADPINTTDPTGDEYTTTITYGNLSDVSTGPGVQLPEGHDTLPGAIMPPPVNLQIEAATLANPPWAAAQALEKAAEAQAETQRLEPPQPHNTGRISYHPITFAATGCTYHGAPGCSGSHGHGNPNEGGHGSCRSGGTRDKHGNCQQGPSGGSNGCSEVFGAGAGFVGGGVGMVVAGPAGAAVGTAVGGEGGAAAGRLCG